MKISFEYRDKHALPIYCKDLKDTLTQKMEGLSWIGSG